MFNRKRGRRIGNILFGAIVAAGLGISAPAQAQNFTKIADLTTPIPNGTGLLTELSQPQVSQGNIVFAGAGTGGQRGIYRSNAATGTLSPIVDHNTALPGGATLFPKLGEFAFSLYGNDVSFVANGGIMNNELLTTRGGLHVVADYNAVPPFGPSSGADTSMDAQHILFGQTYHVSTPPPGADVSGYGEANDAGQLTQHPTLTTVHKFLARGGSAAYSTHNRLVGTTGQYVLNSPAGFFAFSDGATVGGVQQPNFQLPGEPATSYTWAGGPPVFNADGDSVVFSAYSTPDLGSQPTQRGIYTKDVGGQLRTVADNHTLVPDAGGATFSSFGNVAIDGPVIVFSAGGAGGGIYAQANGNLWEIIGSGDTLDGKTISQLSFSGDRPLSGDDLVFTAAFTDGSKGLYLTQVPEPAALASLGGMLLLLRRRR